MTQPFYFLYSIISYTVVSIVKGFEYTLHSHLKSYLSISFNHSIQPFHLIHIYYSIHTNNQTHQTHSTTLLSINHLSITYTTHSIQFYFKTTSGGSIRFTSVSILFIPYIIFPASNHQFHTLSFPYQSSSHFPPFHFPPFCSISIHISLISF